MIVKLADGRSVPVEMHRVKIVQKINLIPATERLNSLRAVGCRSTRGGRPSTFSSRFSSRRLKWS